MKGGRWVLKPDQLRATALEEQRGITDRTAGLAVSMLT